MKSKLLLILLTSALFVNCSPQLNYLGNSYSPTDKVELFFDVKEINKDYTVMGLLNLKIEPLLFNQEENYTTNLIIEKAKKVGANGVLITRFSNETYQEVDEHIMIKKISTEQYDNLIIDAKFLKFND
jgi:hypothetical protein